MQKSEGHVELRSSLCIPSAIEAHSLAADYIQQWFLSKFNKDWFKHVHLDKKHVFDDFRKFDITKNLKIMKPNVTIFMLPQFDFNRDYLDLNQEGPLLYHRKSRLERSFFKDTDRNMYLGITLDQLCVDFTFRIRVTTRAEQVDTARYMKMAFRIGSTQGEDLDLDFHIPYSVILQIANDAEFEVRDNKIVDVVKFTKYLNEHSQLPILYKFRTINGKNEFFVRLTELYTHIGCLDSLAIDDGEVEGQLTSNYTIEMNIQLKMAQPSFYQYYSITEHSIGTVDSQNGLAVGLYNIKLPEIPEKNSRGWNQMMSTEYHDDSSILNIEFEELFEKGTTLRTLIDHNKEMFIDPNLFIEFKLFNAGDEIDINVDWDKMIISSDAQLKDEVTNIIIYVDNLYVNEQIIALKDLQNDRLRKSEK